MATRNDTLTDLPVAQGIPDAAAVADYLRSHPEFLAGRPDLVATLEIPRDNGHVTSLSEYRVDVLRRRNHDLEMRLAELIRIAGDNEKLMQRVHAFNITLMEAVTVRALLQRIVVGLTEDFATDEVRLLLFRRVFGVAGGDWLVTEPQGISAWPALAECVASDGEPRIGRLSRDVLDAAFGPKADAVQSAVVLPLADLGILAMGSHDANRFHPGIGSTFVKLIGETVTAALGRCLATA